MRCSSCEPLLAEYVEGVLPARRMADVAHHVHTCTSCASLIDELKVIDALLATASPVADLPVNFTFAVMAHACSMPTPAPRRLSPWLAVGGYVVAAWALAGLWFAVRGSSALAGIATVFAPFASAWHAIGGIATSAGTAVAPNAAFLGIGIAVLLAIDTIAVVALVYFYRSIRPRLRAAVTLEVRR